MRSLQLEKEKYNKEEGVAKMLTDQVRFAEDQSAQTTQEYKQALQEARRLEREVYFRDSAGQNDAVMTELTMTREREASLRRQLELGKQDHSRMKQMLQNDIQRLKNSI